MSMLLKRISDPARSGVYWTADESAVLDATRGAPLDVARIDLRAAPSKQGLLDAFAAALAFPRWYGGNWDALEDCLSDLSWRKGAGQVVLVAGAQAVARDDLGVLRDVLASAAEFHAERNRPFFAAFTGADNVLGLPPLFRQRK